MIIRLDNLTMIAAGMFGECLDNVSKCHQCHQAGMSRGMLNGPMVPLLLMTLWIEFTALRFAQPSHVGISVSAVKELVSFSSQHRVSMEF